MMRRLLRPIGILTVLALTTLVVYAAASYPSSVKSFTTKLSGQTISSAHVNDLQDEIVAVEGALLNGFAHALKPSSDGAQDLGTSSLRWGTVLANGLRLTDATTLTLATDTATVTHSYHAIDTESAAATDNCSTLTAGSGVGAGFVLTVRAANVAHVVTMKDGTGNLLLNGDYALSTTDATMTLIYDGTNWRELARSITATPSITHYTTTNANVTNTVTETDSVSITVPANDMTDGDYVLLYIAALVNCASPGSPTITPRVYFGASSVSLGAINLTNAGTERKWIFAVLLQRVGADVWVFTPVATSGRLPMLAFSGIDLEAATNVGTIAAPTFTNSNTAKLTIQFNDANANTYFKPQSSRAHRFF